MPQAYKLINILQKLSALRASLPRCRRWLVCGWLLLVAPPILADVVKPALVEISISTDGTYKVELNGLEATYNVTKKVVQEQDLFLEIVSVTSPIGKGYTATLSEDRTRSTMHNRSILQIRS